LEIGALLSIKQQQVDSFERYIIQLKTFYSQKYLILTRPESPRMYMLLGLNLLRLLAQGKYSEFHVELESIPSKELKNIYINHPLMIEQSLMEGSYSKIYTTLHDVPAQEYNFFMNILQKTIR
jgi:26S proteasome regulatory subunit N12